MTQSTSPASDPFVADFENPPLAARPRVWWHWMNGNITKDGIRKDIEWMKRVGIGGLQNFDGALDTPQVVDKRLIYMTPEWKDAFRYAVDLADQSGLEFAIASSPGWSETGGPWVKPEDGMKKLVWSATALTGGQRFQGSLPTPPSVSGPFQDIPMADIMTGKEVKGPAFYRDVAVIAYRTPPAQRHDPEPTKITTSDPSIDAASLLQGNTGTEVTLAISKEKPAWVLYDYGQPQRFRSASVARPATTAFAWVLESSDDGVTFRQLAELPRGYSIRRNTVSFPAVTARFLRLTISPKPFSAWFDLGANAPGAIIANRYTVTSDRVSLTEMRFYTGARIHRFEDKAGFSLPDRYYELDGEANVSDEAVDPNDVIDLTSEVRADGTLDWTPPPGDWTVLRLGYSLTGKTNHPASSEATGLEVDKLDAHAVKRYLDAYLGNFDQTVGPDLIGPRGIRAFLTDSIESSGQNWTPAMIAEFQARRGYSPTPWLPALTGVIVGTAARSDRFLWDFRRTLMELISEAHYGQIAKAVHARGMIYYSESLEGYPTMALGDDLDMREHADIPMAAIWTSYRPSERDGVANHVVDMMGAASVAHVFGQSLVAAESLTSAYEPWAFSPATLKPIIDLAFALGVNRPVIHTSVHQPTELKPGMTLGPYGQHFSRHETWGEMAGPWMAYLARSSYLLQQGQFAADVAWFYGEEGPVASLAGDWPPAGLPEGYGFDFVSPNTLLNHLTAGDGRLVAPSGAGYRLLYLGGASARMTLKVLRRLKELSEKGVVIAGPRATGSPSLADDGHEAEYSRLVAELWDSGKIIEQADPSAVLANLGIERDFDYKKSEPDSNVLFLHRRLADGDVYFLTNRKPRAERIEARFRVTGKKPELWHADTGVREAVSWQSEGGQTIVTLDLAADDSVFVVFRESTAQSGESVREIEEQQVLRIDGEWQLSFEPDRGAPTGAHSAALACWTESSEPGIRYFSGVGTYHKTVIVEPETLRAGARFLLDLGEVHEVAEVMLNGKSVGTAWHAPFRLDVTEALKPGTNQLDLSVANLWVNRLIGDQQPGATPIASSSTTTYKADAPLRTSGLLGPVVLIRVE